MDNWSKTIYAICILYLIGLFAAFTAFWASCNTKKLDESTMLDSVIESVTETITTAETATTTKEETTTTTDETTTETTTEKTTTTERTTTKINYTSTQIWYDAPIDTVETLISFPPMSTQPETVLSSASTTLTTSTAQSDIVPCGTKTFVKTFKRGTYYCYGCAMNGGSGRQLISCGAGDGTVKGSIASSYLYNQYGYNYNGQRTKVYLEVGKYPEMTGYYYLDDSDAGNSEVIDFFYIYASECPFRLQGVITVDCYICN